jgi:hypothetical protein
MSTSGSIRILLAAVSLAVASRAQAPASQPALPSQAELEQRFADMMTDVVFVGNWQAAGEEALAGKGKLGKVMSERYSIQSAVKDKDDYWLIVARMEFGEFDTTLPLRLRVVWAGDTPIITLDDLPIPGVGIYSARVMVYRNVYSGTWFGKGYGGVMAGQILKRADFERLFPASQPAEE